MTDIQKLEKAIASLSSIKKEVEGSLSIRAMGGVFIANELIKLVPMLEEVKASLEAPAAPEGE